MNTAKHNLKVSLFEDGRAVVWTSIGPIYARGVKEIAELLTKIALCESMDTYKSTLKEAQNLRAETVEEFCARGGTIQVVNGSLRRGEIKENLTLEDIGL